MTSTNFRALAGIVVVSIAVIGGHLLPGLDNSRVEDGVRNGLHVLVFAALAVFLFEKLKSAEVSTIIAAAITIAAVAAIGGLSELLQHLRGREPDTGDVMRDVSGAIMALVGRTLWCRSRDEQKSRISILGLRAASGLVSLSIVVPLVFWLLIIGLGRTASPVILDFSEWWSEYLYRPLNAQIVTSGNREGAAEILLLKRRRSGVIISPMMTDWSGYEFLTITAGMLKGPDTNVTVRINDSAHRNSWANQFLAPIVVVSGLSRIRIPLGDLLDEPGQPSMNLTDIQEVGIFARDRGRDTILLIDDIRLE